MLPEWLSGDPLCGIGTTIGFFIFLILGRYVRKKMVEKNGSLHTQD